MKSPSTDSPKIGLNESFGCKQSLTTVGDSGKGRRLDQRNLHFLEIKEHEQIPLRSAQAKLHTVSYQRVAATRSTKARSDNRPSESKSANPYVEFSYLCAEVGIEEHTRSRPACTIDQEASTRSPPSFWHWRGRAPRPLRQAAPAPPLG